MRTVFTTMVVTTATAALLAQPLAAQQSQQSGSTEAAPQQLSPQDTQFAEKAAQGGMLEVRLGELATQQGKNEEVVDFGQMMVEDHSEANQKLEDIARQKAIQLPQELSEEGQQHYEELQQLSGAEFDRQYIDLMVEDHKKDIETFQTQADAGLDPELVAFAEETLPVLERHLERAEEIQPQVAAAAAGGQQQGATGDQLAAMNPEDLVGGEVLNSEGEAIGEVEDVVADRDQVPHAVVSVGGFLGLGEKEVVVPMDRLTSGHEGQGLTTDLTQDELEGLPAYEEEQYSSLVQPQ